MSEYQYHEFQAIDRPLSAAEREQLRAISSRARITATSFVNTYDYGDLKADPLKLLERYFDLFCYVADGGTHWFAMRLPGKHVNVEALKRFQLNEDLAPDPARRRTSDRQHQSRRDRKRRLGRWRPSGGGDGANAERRAREEKEAKARAQRLAALAKRGEAVWREVEDLIIMRNASACDQAMALLADLGEIAAAGNRRDRFDGRIAELHARHARKGQFIARLKAAGL
jgi:hypothetical protein